MKTAVCLSGRLSNIENYENLYENIIGPYAADVFIDTWIPFAETSMKLNSKLNEQEKENMRSWDVVPPPDPPPADIFEFANKYQPKMMNMEHFDAVPITHQIRSVLPTNKKTAAGWDSPGTKAENVFFMWYKIWKANQMRKIYEQTNRVRYDCIIRLRFDNTFKGFPVIDPKRKTVYIPNGGDYEGGICDQLAIADSVTMDLYCELYNEIYRYTTGGIGIHPESMLLKHLQINRLNIERFDCDFELRGIKQ